MRYFHEDSLLRTAIRHVEELGRAPFCGSAAAVVASGGWIWAWPASCCTVLRSAPASRRSPMNVRNGPRAGPASNSHWSRARCEFRCGAPLGPQRTSLDRCVDGPYCRPEPLPRSNVRISGRGPLPNTVCLGSPQRGGSAERRGRHLARCASFDLPFRSNDGAAAA